MVDLMIHTPTGQRTGYDSVCRVPVPQSTDSYRPVSNHDLIGLIRSKIDTILDMEIMSEQYGLGQKGQQLFGVITLRSPTQDNKDNGLSIGFRNSYNKSLSVGIASGARVFVCDNLCFSGSSMVVMRKHTQNVWDDLTGHIEDALFSSHSHYASLESQIEQMKQAELTHDDGYSIIGRAQGHGILLPRQAKVAFKDWDKPRHKSFAAKNLWSLYNCFTEGLKLGQTGTVLRRHIKAHSFFAPMLEPVNDAPQFVYATDPELED